MLNETLSDAEALVVGATDDELSGLKDAEAKELFARGEAMGAGDFELTAVPKDEAGAPFVDALDPVVPDWSDSFLDTVKKGLLERPADIAKIGEMVAGSAFERDETLARAQYQFDKLVEERRKTQS